jgi:hypothetical protein
MPLNAEPIEHGGTFTLQGIIAVFVPKEERHNYALLYVPHHATCPAVAEWRRKKIAQA